MEDSGKEKFVDELLEASLRRYRREEPRVGLENRILAHVLSPERATRGWIWTWALGAAAGVLVIFVVLELRQHPAPTPSPEQMVVEKTAPPAILPPVADSTSPKPSLRAARRPVPSAPRTVAPPSRPAQFPTPAPLSEQERLLLAYLELVPRSELNTPVIRDPKIEPLQFSEIRIARIEIKELPKLIE